MGVFEQVARPAIMAASRSGGLRRTAERLPVTREVVHRFVPGETVADALESVGQLRNSDRLVSIDYLGEDVTDVDAASATVEAYLALLDALDRRGEAAAAVRPLEVSLKLSALGQALPRDGEKIALENAHTICERAQRAGAWVTVDAEDHTTTDSTLSIVRDLRTEFGWLGTVLQAYLQAHRGRLRRSSPHRVRASGCARAPTTSPRRWPTEIVRTSPTSYLRCLRVLMAGDGYPMVASHDPEIIEAVPAMVREFGRGVDDFEYQMLYGIRDAEQRRLADDGQPCPRLRAVRHAVVRLFRASAGRAARQLDVLPDGRWPSAVTERAPEPPRRS